MAGFSRFNFRGSSYSMTELSIGAALVMMQTSAILYADFMNVIILGMHEELAYSLQIAGDICSFNLAFIALGALAGALFSRQLTGARWAVSFIAAIALLDALSMFLMPWQALAVLRGLHGLACGGLLACCGAALSHSARPERIMGASLAIQLALASYGARFFPVAIRNHGLGIVFFVMCLVEVFTAVLVLRCLVYFSKTISTKRDEERPSLSLTIPVKALCLASLLGLFLFQASRFIVVGYGFQIGEFFALKRPFVGAVISVSNWLAGAGALIAMTLPRRIGRMWPLLVAGIGMMLSEFSIIGFGTNPTVFAVATGLASMLTFIALPYLYGVCFTIDTSGGLGIWTGFSSKVGLAIGPALGALLLSYIRLPLVLAISAALVFAATLLASWPARISDESSGIA